MAVFRFPFRVWFFTLLTWLMVSASPVGAEPLQPSGPDSPIPDRYFYAVNHAGQLLIYIDASTDTETNWIAQAVIAPVIPGVNWANFQQVFAGGDGIIYAVDGTGHLHYFRLIDRWRNAGPTRWSDDSNTTTDETGWDTLTLRGFSRFNLADQQSGTLIRAIWSSAGNFYRHGWRNDGVFETDYHVWTNSGLGVPQTWFGPHIPPQFEVLGGKLLEGGNGLSYWINAKGKLFRFRQRPDGRWVDRSGETVPEANVQPLLIGIGWDATNFDFVTAEPGEYAIEGYVSTVGAEGVGTIARVSVAPGDRIKVRASTFSDSYQARLIRLSRDLTADDTAIPSGLVTGEVIVKNVTVNIDPLHSSFKKAESFQMSRTGAGWKGDGADLFVPPDAPSGIYAVELSTPSGGLFRAPFIVRPAKNAPLKNIALIANVATWNAYNDWGGSSRYSSWTDPLINNTAGQPPLQLSFERPFAETGIGYTGTGLTNRGPRLANHLARAEIWVQTWLDTLAARNERFGFDVYSDMDLHAGIAHLESYKLIILDTHPEYWSDTMLDGLERYLDSGGHLLNISGNGLFDRFTLSSGGALRIANGVGGDCTGPAGNPCPPRDLFAYARPGWPNGRSERAVLGEAYEILFGFAGLGGGAGYTLIEPSHAFFAGLPCVVSVDDPCVFGAVAGLNANQQASAWEVNSHATDAACTYFPGQVCTSSHLALRGNKIASDGSHGDVVFRKTAGGAGWVFSLGSITFGGVLAIDPRTQRVIHNAIIDALR